MGDNLWRVFVFTSTAIGKPFMIIIYSVHLQRDLSVQGEERGRGYCRLLILSLAIQYMLLRPVMRLAALALLKVLSQ